MSDEQKDIVLLHLEASAIDRDVFAALFEKVKANADHTRAPIGTGPVADYALINLGETAHLSVSKFRESELLSGSIHMIIGGIANITIFVE